ncbi:hypothetical protein DVJ77_09925 [Dyella tabacisoli]|uniref:Uncharacterized protein n=1 Tax=Dyella tabacisoli TaxID=2282381 RepID=A0A369UL49_9GAMM|nr:hypothetical protein DVJ77_09925 [Dyella tabacisoli]
MIFLVCGIVGLRIEFGGPSGYPSGHSAKMLEALGNLENAANGKPQAASSASLPGTQQPGAEASDDIAVRTVNQVAAAVVELRQHCERIGKAMAALPLNQMLSANNLSSKAGIQASRNALASFNSLLDEFDGAGNDYFKRVKNILLTLPPKEQAEAMHGFNTSYRLMNGAISDYVGTLRKIDDTTAAVLDLAQHNLGRTQLRNGKLAMPHEVLTQFNALIATLHIQAQASKQAEARLVQMIAKGRQGFTDFKTELRRQ